MILRVALFLVTFWSTTLAGTPVNMCNSPVYCGGNILMAANKYRVGLSPGKNDSKYFVDRPLKVDPATAVLTFNQKFPDPNNIKDLTALSKFIDETFDEPHSELKTCALKEWKPNPGKIMAIRDQQLRSWALKIHGIWKTLCREMKDSVKEKPDQHSLLYVPHPFVVPGGRFQEFYYWDTYWIIRGLMVSELYDTAMDMIRNFVHIFKTYGLIPNGGRVYYLQRSQPPMLTPMVYEIWRATRNLSFVKEVLPTLEKEFAWWGQHRRFNITGADGKKHAVYQYNTPSNVPRPESYKEDVESCTVRQGDDGKQSCYRDLASAAESGWDFSSRWLVKGSINSTSSIRTRQIFPVDLNSILCWNMEILQLFNTLTGNTTVAKTYESMRDDFRRDLTAVFYNSTEKAWFDWDNEVGKHHVAFYPTVAVPLFTGCYQSLNTFRPSDVFDYANRTTSGVGKRLIYPLREPSGVPTSLQETGQQWDFPNGWPPLQHIVIEGFRKSKNPMMQREAFRMAQDWVSANVRAFNFPKFYGHMYEKYNVSDPEARPGAGGEYEVQSGFGWTNGVVLDLMYTYSERMEYQYSGSEGRKASLLLPLAAAVLAALFHR